ncbi:MAG TPA: hypothetical protein VHU84_07655 [Lacipirellulaceae bacterium]|nr:hypothetical protein [Lacipirellulaceae bacterium]
MTKALQDAIERLRQAPEDRQDALAALLVHELEEDERWASSTAAHSEKLGGFVQDVLEASRRGEYEPLDPDQL